VRSAAEDDDIEAGAQTFRFTCPLSYVPISTPVRSTICPHAQCFDALAFYSMNSVTPTWECPVCSQNFKPENLFVDGCAMRTRAQPEACRLTFASQLCAGHPAACAVGQGACAGRA
jgi:SUMO ligase MMS21 Smc5/6 complex component